MSPISDSRLRAGREAIEDLKRYRRDIPLDRFLVERDDQRKVMHALLIAV